MRSIVVISITAPMVILGSGEMISFGVLTNRVVK